MEEKTICAISTPLGNSAISIIRMSGKESLSIAKKYFFSKSLNYEEIEPRKMYLGTFIDKDISEKCLMVYFKKPFSYTGEDIVEFQIHGGEYLAKKILQILADNCSFAMPGEFTKRAFFNGKISLNEAEGVIDIINAETKAELDSAFNLSTGKFNKQILEFQKELKEVLARIEVALDYPEHDEELITTNQAMQVLNKISEKLQDLIGNSTNGEKLKTGVNIAICGSPNVGKSSLLNAILGKERAIVSNIAGTTRDTISETIVYKGIKFNFTDTAGIRKQGDEVEKIGIERAKKEIEKSDLTLFVLDLTREILEDERELLTSLDKNKTIVVLNKKDIATQKNLEGYTSLCISAKKEENITDLLDIIYEKTIANKIDLSKIVLTNMRHVKILKDAKEVVDETLKNIYNLSLDVIAFEIKRVWQELGKITGETETEEIIDEIFSKFCLGK